MVAIFVALMFVGLVLIDLAVNRLHAWRAARAKRAARPASVGVPYALEALCEVPEGIHLAPQHLWIKPDPAGGLEIGADALIARAMGTACRIVLPQKGETIRAGDPLFRLENHGRILAVSSSVTGQITDINNLLADQPQLLSADPYEKGWVCHLTPSRVEDRASAMRFGEQATMWLKEEFGRFQDFIFGQIGPDLALGATSQDGGLPAVGCLGELGPTAWTAFEEEFLRRQ